MGSKLLDEQFELKGNSPSAWLLTAKRLRRSGDLVFDAYAADLEKLHKGVSSEGLQNLYDLEVAGCAMLLYGLGIENAAKGLVVAKAVPPAVASGELRKWPGSGHSLKTLLSDAGVMLSPQEEDLVVRLTAFVAWAGRYPIPKRAEKMTVLLRNIDPPNAWVPLPFSTTDREAYGALFARLESIF